MKRFIRVYGSGSCSVRHPGFSMLHWYSTVNFANSEVLVCWDVAQWFASSLGDQGSILGELDQKTLKVGIHSFST